MGVAGRTRRGPTVTSYHVQLSDGQEFTVIADAAQRRSAAERSTTTVSLHDAARAAREKADVSLGPRDHQMALALAAAVRAEENRVLLGLIEPANPAPPPWSEVSKPITGEGPMAELEHGVLTAFISTVGRV